MYAVILTGGKQYRVKEGDVLEVEKLGLEPGRKAQFDQVLLLEDGESVQVGTPFLDSAMVIGLVLENFKDRKVIVFKKKRRKQYKRTRGHRQPLTRIRIERIAPDRSLLTAEDLTPVAAPEPGTPSDAARRSEAAAPAAKPSPAPAKRKAAAKPTAPKTGQVKPVAKLRAAAKPARAKAKKAAKE